MNRLGKHNWIALILLGLGLMLAMAVAPMSVSALTHYYVDHAAGNDSNSGLDADEAFLTPAKAANTVGAGSKVWLLAGTYSTQDAAEDAVFRLDTAGAANNPIIWEGWNGVSTGTFRGDGTFACVIIDAGPNSLTNAMVSSLASAYNHFKYIYFTGASGDGVSASSMNRCLFQDCRFGNNGGIGVRLNIQNGLELCQADNNTGNGYQLGDGCHLIASSSFSNGGVGGVFSNEGLIEKSLFYENTGDQITFNARGSIINCTIDGGGTANGITGLTHGHRIINCIVYDCDPVGLTGTAGAAELQISKNNLFFSNTADVSGWPTDPSDVSGDPQFVGANDYRLTNPGSPALAAGVDVGVIDGVTSSSHADMGALQAEPVAGGNVIVIDD